MKWKKSIFSHQSFNKIMEGKLRVVTLLSKILFLSFSALSSTSQGFKAKGEEGGHSAVGRAIWGSRLVRHI